jgi:transcription initiation factor TFIIIB Brf1 subunit/transcription initiation factor TFIIB
MAGKRYIRLKTPRDVSRFISGLINQTNRNEIDSEKARTLGYLAKILLESLEKTELQTEIERIKEKLGLKDESEKRAEAH